jgi:hypothetical protein
MLEQVLEVKASQVQSVLIPRAKYTREQAEKWLSRNGYHNYKIDISETYYRFRQIDPGRFKDMRTKSLPGGIKLIIGF